jgi:putative hydrolase of the HAD superfamily
MLNTTQSRVFSREKPAPKRRGVVAFDGDDTLWLCHPEQQRWERDCKRRGVAQLPHRDLAARFRHHIREFGWPQDGVARALHACGREFAPGKLPADWQAQLDAVPDLTGDLDLRPAPGLPHVLDRLAEAGYALWIITRGDLLRQAIKLACFPLASRFDFVEIVKAKNVATYQRIFAEQECSPQDVIMVGDSFADDIVPPLRLGARAVHVPVGRFNRLLAGAERALPTPRLALARRLTDLPDLLADWQHR